MTEVSFPQKDALPADRCPYRGPFLPDFQGCPTFRPMVFAVADSTEKLLGTNITCVNLRSGEQSQHRYYPRCALGSQQERLEWLGLVSPERLAIARALTDDFETLNVRFRARLIEAKADVLAHPRDLGARQHLDGLLSEFLDQVEAFTSEQSPRFADIGLPADRMNDLIKEWSIAWLRSKSLDLPPPGDDRALAGLEQAAAGLIPTAAAGGTQLAGSQTTLFDDGTLCIMQAAGGVGLVFLGEIDASNAGAVGDALEEAAAHASEVRIDFSAVTFCDLGGLRAIVRASSERRIVVFGMTAHLERALRIAGWAELPNLVLAGDSEDTGVRVGA